MTKYYSDVYECVENGGDVQENIDGMTLDEMMDFFSDADPSEWL